MSTHQYPILLVDDQQFIGVAVGRLLAAERDLALHCCHSATDAMDTARRVAPALILQDLMMPEIDGLTLVRSFRRDPLTARVPIIVLSGHDDPETRARSLEAGAVDYLVKLPGRGQLLACVRRHLAAGGESADMPTGAVSGATDVQTQTLDSGLIASLCAGGPAAAGLAARLIDQFVDEVTMLVGRLEAAITPLDAAAIKQAAHSLRGTSTTMGAQRLAILSRHAEEQADRPGHGIEPLLLQAIREELIHVQAACRRARIESGHGEHA